MYPRDHNPPHFHALYGEHEGVFGIVSLELTEGGLPSRATALVLEWARQHQTELLLAWNQRAAGSRMEPIAPLP